MRIDSSDARNVIPPRYTIPKQKRKIIGEALPPTALPPSLPSWKKKKEKKKTGQSCGVDGHRESASGVPVYHNVVRLRLPSCLELHIIPRAIMTTHRTYVVRGLLFMRIVGPEKAKRLKQVRRRDNQFSGKVEENRLGIGGSGSDRWRTRREYHAGTEYSYPYLYPLDSRYHFTCLSCATTLFCKLG